MYITYTYPEIYYNFTMYTLQATAAKNARLSAMEGLQTSARVTARAMTMGPASAGRNSN
jgi:hypothetical protein